VIIISILPTQKLYPVSL